LAAVSVTAIDRLPFALYTLPVLLVAPAARLRVDVPATALALPVSVNFQTRAPAEATLGALQADVKPFGNPAVMLMPDPVTPARTAPPTGVAVTVTVFTEIRNTESVCGDTFRRIPGAAWTCSVTLLLATKPSPEAVTTTVAEPTAAVEAAVRVNTSVFVLTLAEGVAGLTDHFALTPAGSPLIE
jgi:hypothetical protein